METKEAINLLEEYIQATMANGVIKNFATLDKLREAVKTLRQELDSKLN